MKRLFIIKSLMEFSGEFNFRHKNISKFAFLISFLILTFPILASSVLAETNLIMNSDLESGTTTPLNWTFVNQGGNIPIWDNVFHSGSRSIEISIPGTTNIISGYPQSDIIEAQPLTTYIASVWGKTQNSGGSNTPAARVVELDANKTWIRQTNILPVFDRGTNDWTQRQVEFQTAANTRYLYVYANIWNGYGNFWMDDVVLRLKDVPTSTPEVTATPTVTATPEVTVTPTVTVTPEVTEAPIPSSDATIVYMGDSHPEQFGTAGITELTKNFNQVVPQSPTGKVDAIVLMGDFVRYSMVQQAFADSNVQKIPVFWVMGNHEAKVGDAGAIRNLYSILKLPTNPGPNGTDKTTYSFNVGNIHVINMNEYWDGEKNDAWIGGGISGGYVGTALYNWISNDLSKTSDWKIVVGHEPLYPSGKLIGNSLDSDKANRDKLQALFVSEKVSVFVSGHTHSASIVKHDTVYHVASGVTGAKKRNSNDKFQSLIYTYTTTNNLVLTWKHENPTWSTPKIETYTISK